VFRAAAHDGPPPDYGPLFGRRRVRVLHTTQRQRARPVLGHRDAEDPAAAATVRVTNSRGHARPAAPPAGHMPRQDGHVRGRETGGVRPPPITAAAASPPEPSQSAHPAGSAAAASQVQWRFDRVEFSSPRGSVYSYRFIHNYLYIYIYKR